MRSARAGSRRSPGWAALLVAVPLVVAGCLSFDEPSPSPSPVRTVTPAPSVSPRDPATLVVVVPTPPLTLVPPAANGTESLLHDLLYDPLYRLDESLRPHPALARGLPEVSEDGLTWTIELDREARFHDGREVTADDVAFSLRLASSAACPFARELCATVADHMVAAEAPRPGRLTITLDEPFAPFLAEALGRLPILSQRAVRDATASLLDAIGRLGSDTPDELVTSITDATGDDTCFVETPPRGCRLADHRADLERIHRRAGLPLPPEAAFTDATGVFDEEAYAGALLDRVATLARLLTTSAADQHAAGLRLLDVTASPLGGGPYRLERSDDPGRLVLVAHEGHAGGPPGIGRIELVVEPDPANAATALLSGTADWVLEVGLEQEASLGRSGDVTVGRRPVPLQRAILFNVRAGRLYEDPRLRQAFALCLDRAAVSAAVGADRPLAVTPSAPDSWAMPRLPQPVRDPARARALLEDAGWPVGEDGIRERFGRRLSSGVAVRASRADLSSFMVGAADQLAECGIELRTEELDTVGDTFLEQLQWPNDFDTLLVARPLGLDPDRDAMAFESAHITSEANPADANASGYASDIADEAIAAARRRATPEQRRTDYLALQTRLAVEVPWLPIWYDTATSALSHRLRGPDGEPVDPSRPRFDWDVGGWSLGSDR